MGNKSGFAFHCPHCGELLQELPRPEPVEIDWGDPDLDVDEAVRKMDVNAAVDRDESIDFACPKGCFQKDFPLKAHHPVYGTQAAPGDSWSLSWIK